MVSPTRLRSLFVLGCLTASPLLLAGCNQDAPAQPHAVSDLPVVSVVSPTVTTIRRTTTQPATVHAYHQAQIYAKVSGYLDELKVDIGQTVSKDDPLGIISVPEMQKSREKQEADIRRLVAEEGKAAALIKLAAAQVTSAKAELDRAKADIATAVSQLNADKFEFDRVTDLVNQKAVAARLLDEATQKFESSQSAKASADAALQSATAAVTVAQEQEAVAKAEETAAKAQTDVGRSELDEIDAMISYATLKAPFAGVVTQRHVDLGDLVRNIQTASESSRKPLFEVSQVDRVRVRISVAENEAPLAGEGDAVSLRLKSLPDRPFDGVIKRVAKRLDEATRTMLVEMELKNEEGLLLPGMYGEATINLEETPNAIVLPATAVRFDETGNSSVYVVGSDSTISIVVVKTGYDDGKQIQILSGLDASARVVDGKLGRLKEGEKVKIVDGR
jgi:RND family efflux transporter MFP subunit